ncbi:MAG: carboxymuconolactone decarboxylase family protein [Chloroflexi bacterium]|nr:carboxymuconolactone decarboxylase family protein [Chloroflexota bacterium]MCI0859350.1 carboxymuconolactone decarboxylase family protein [Chloroflexota bacterium]MCI0867117.1 carboxymuconolactone decarboxylase family protein [Chloroflexota bacterium]
MTTPRTAMQEVAPKLAEIAADVLFGDIWERPGLSKRDRSMITVATLIALYRTGQIPGHINRALDNGVTKEEIGEIITHVAFYAGVPTAANAAGLVKEVFDKR